MTKFYLWSNISHCLKFRLQPDDFHFEAEDFYSSLCAYRNLLSTQYSKSSNNASGLSHSIGILVKQMPFVSFASIRYEGKFERDHKKVLLYSGTLPYGHLSNTVAALLLQPCFLAWQNCHTFPYQKKTLLLQSPINTVNGHIMKSQTVESLIIAPHFYGHCLCISIIISLNSVI